jgi:transcriptional regulator with XRE-family HTH domain
VASAVNLFLGYLPSVSDEKSHQAICSQVARLLHEERVLQGLSLKTLAERAGLSRQMVSYVEQEERNPTLDTLLRISTALGVKLEELIAQAQATVSKKKSK